MNWLILRVFAGRPLHVEHTIREMGIQAYCPVQTIKRRHPRGKEIIVQRTPLLPNYLFAAEHFDLDRINTTRTKARWLQLGGRLCQITPEAIESVRACESQWRPDLIDLAHVLGEIARGMVPRKNRFVRLSEFRQEMVA